MALRPVAKAVRLPENWFTTTKGLNVGGHVAVAIYRRCAMAAGSDAPPFFSVAITTGNGLYLGGSSASVKCFKWTGEAPPEFLEIPEADSAGLLEDFRRLGGFFPVFDVLRIVRKAEAELGFDMLIEFHLPDPEKPVPGDLALPLSKLVEWLKQDESGVMKTLKSLAEAGCTISVDNPKGESELFNLLSDEPILDSGPN